MFAFTTDTGKDSFLYDNTDPDDSIVAPDLPQFNDMSVMEVAHYLDSQLSNTQQVPKPSLPAPATKKVRMPQINTQVMDDKNAARPTADKGYSNNGSSKDHRSPGTDKAWIPLSQSTPMDVPPGAQPKDLLKSRLSKLAQTVHVAATDDDGDEPDGKSDDESNISYLDEDTPSKVRPQQTSTEKVQATKQLEIVQQQERQAEELKELRDLKHFLLEVNGGLTFVEKFRSGVKADQFEVLTRDDLNKHQELIENSERESRSSHIRTKELEERLKKETNEFAYLREQLAETEKKKTELELENAEFSVKIEELTLRIEDARKSDEELKESKNSLQNEVQRLVNELKEFKGKHDAELETSLAEISRLKAINDELRDESNVVKGTNMSLKEMLEIKDKLTLEKQSENDSLKTLIMELEKTIKKSTDDYKTLKDQLQTELNNIRGNSEDAVIPGKYPELLNRTPCGLSLYDDLELPEVDRLTLIGAQNVIKNVLINLGIPFSKTKKMIPGISVQLQHEGILRDFVSKTHRLLYNEDMSLDFYMEADKRGKEHLTQCTTQMYKNLELLYSVLNKTV